MKNKRVSTFKRGNNWSYSFEGNRKEVVTKEVPILRKTRITKPGYATEQEAKQAGLEHMKKFYDNNND